MPLLDHFRPPVSSAVPWEPFLGGWAYEMAGSINLSLSGQGYRAAPHIQFKGHYEVETAPLTARLVAPTIFPDDIEVQIFETELGRGLVAAVGLVSPRNKDRLGARRLFASKCAAYLHRGVGVVIVDAVTLIRQNLHDELMRLLDLPETFSFPDPSPLYAVAYRPSTREDTGQIEVWTFPLTLGHDLPVVPLALLNGPTVPLDLEMPYQETRLKLVV